jgi:hypothetical protein
MSTEGSEISNYHDTCTVVFQDDMHMLSRDEVSFAPRSFSIVISKIFQGGCETCSGVRGFT